MTRASFSDRRTGRAWLAAGLVAMVLLGAGGGEASTSPQWTWDDPAVSEVWAVAMTADGATVAAGSYGGSGQPGLLVVFDWRSPWPILRVELPAGVVDVSLSADGQRVACVAGPTVYVYDLPGTLVHSYSVAEGTLTECRLTADGTRLMASRLVDDPYLQVGGSVFFFDLETPELLWSDVLSEHIAEPSSPRLRTCRLSEDGTRIFVVFEAGALPGNLAWATLYQTDSATPDVPVWVSDPFDTWDTYGALSGDGRRGLLSAAVDSHYFDLTTPASGAAKLPEWSYTGTGFYTFVHRVASARDGGRTAHFGPYNFWQGEPNYGVVEVIDGATGSPLWSLPTELQGPTGDISPDGARVAYSADFLGAEFTPSITVADAATGAPIWVSIGVMGRVVLDEHGERLAAAGGRQAGTMDFQPLRFFRIESNFPPVCQIAFPAPGATVGGLVEVIGTAGDEDGSLSGVELLGPDGPVAAEAAGATFENWTATIDFYGAAPGPFTLQARAIDDRFKHGAWDEVDLTVIEVTPTPTASATPTASPTPGPEATATPTPPPWDELTLVLELPQTVFHPGDVFRLDALVFNPDEPRPDVPLFALLEVHGAFYCWPSWSRLQSDGAGLDYARRDFPPGLTRSELVPIFLWPDGAGQEMGLIFYAALMRPDLAGLLTEIDMAAWGFAP